MIEQQANTGQMTLRERMASLPRNGRVFRNAVMVTLAIGGVHKILPQNINPLHEQQAAAAARKTPKPPPNPLTKREGDFSEAQLRLAIKDGYKGKVDGKWGFRSKRAMKHWERRHHQKVDGRLSKDDYNRLRRGSLHDNFRVRLDQGSHTLTLLDNNRPFYRTRTSSGMRGFEERPGPYRVYAQYPGWRWSEKWKGWMFDSSFFDGNFGIHGSSNVPSWNASHGCFRLEFPDAHAIFRVIQNRTPVDVVR